MLNTSCTHKSILCGMKEVAICTLDNSLGFVIPEWRAEGERQSSQMLYIPTRQMKWKILDQWRHIHLEQWL